MAFRLQDKDSPYVHSNYYLFANQLRAQMQNPITEDWQNRMAKRINDLKRIRDSLEAEAKDFLGGDDPKAAFQKIKRSDSALSKMGQKVIADPGARKALLKESYSKKKVQKDLLSDEAYQMIESEIVEEIDIKELTELVSRSLFKDGGEFQLSSGKSQKEILKKLFRVSEDKLDKILNDNLKKQLKSSTGKIQKIIKKLLEEAAKENKSEPRQSETAVFNNFMAFFKRRLREEISKQGLYSTDDGQDIVDKYIRSVEQKLKPIIKKHYSATEASGSLGEEIRVEVVNAGNSAIYEIATGSKTETEIRTSKDLMNTTNALVDEISKAATWNDPEKMSYTDLILVRNIGGVEKRVRAQSKNYAGAYETFLRTENVYQHTHLFSRQMLFKEFFTKLQTESGGRLNLSSDLDLNELSYIVANEWWFDEKGSTGSGEMQKGWRENKTNTRLFGSDSFLSRALSGAFVNFLGIVVDESGEVIPNLSNVFFLIDNAALVPTYELIDNVLSYYESGVSQMTNIHITVYRNGVSPTWTSPERFLQAKGEAVEDKGGLGAATYEDDDLVKVGKQQGSSIMNTLQVSSVNLGVDLKNLLESAWCFDV